MHEFVDERSDGVPAAMDGVGPVGAREREPFRSCGAYQEGEERLRRTIRPLQILDDQHEWGRPGRFQQDSQELLEQSRLRAVRRQWLGRLDVDGGSKQPVQVGGRAGPRAVLASAHDSTQRSDDRRIRKLTITQRRALTDEHQCARGCRATCELREESTLPDP